MQPSRRLVDLRQVTYYPWAFLMYEMRVTELVPPPFFFLFGGTGVSTKGLTLSNQALYHLSHTPALFCFSYFSGRVWCIPPTQKAGLRLQSSYLCLPHAGIIGLDHYAWLIGVEGWDLTNFLRELALKLSIFTSQVAGITGLSHCACFGFF
jgi:hypothetical protein